MNQIEAILHELSDPDLRVAVHELHSRNLSGVLPGGVVRALSKRIAEEARIPGHDARTIAEDSIYRMAAHRWAGIKES